MKGWVKPKFLNIHKKKHLGEVEGPPYYFLAFAVCPEHVSPGLEKNLFPIPTTHLLVELIQGEDNMLRDKEVRPILI